MINFIIICLIAGGLGATLQGMLGTGTGIITIPVLTFILPYYGIPKDLSIHIALATAIAAIAINSTSALITHHKRGNIQWPLFKKMVIFSALGSYLGASIGSITSGRYLESIFGIFMLLMAIYMLTKKPVIDSTESTPTIPLPVIATGGFSIACIAAVTGTGGGIFMVPFLHSQKLKMRYAIGTSTLIGLPVAMIGAITYLVTGLSHLSPSPFTIGYLHWPALLAISLTGIICAPIGARLSTVLPTRTLQVVFAICMMVVGLKMMMMF